MRAALFEEFGNPLIIRNVADPIPDDNGVIIKVKASGICRSDWHGWQGHDPDITHLPHVPGHELAGIIAETGKNVENWNSGDRVTVPFVAGCGYCPECQSGNHQVCDNQTQPGFTHWGSFAEYVLINYADVNLIRIPEEMEYVTASILGCRFGTAFRAVVHQGAVKSGHWVAIHGCGGVGISAIMIAHALGARVIAIDINDRTLELAKSIGADVTINASKDQNILNVIHDITGGGVNISVDALGSVITCVNSIACLRKRGRHVQVGLLAGNNFHPRLPMEHVIAKELELYGSHGMPAHKYPEMLKMITSGKLNPKVLIGKTVDLENVPLELEKMSKFESSGITVINQF
ncbi:zinc-dependent alcohol dehydrogenase family protein [Candidatus Neomarinimicrobiota bacterium]